MDDFSILVTDSMRTVFMGVGVVFFGLICLILIVQVMHAILNRFAPADCSEPKAAPAVAPTPASATEPEIEHNILVALASAAVAEQLGKDVDAIRICSIRKI